ncbi:tetratricopeptide repeat protein [Acaryochloris sp. IP29b_bin.148]|uniref:tetratricopeptide repeat protein n=1 Tax=Acaryochloris sp. IP29b_bin.148 TaxID=2969218 RepID=UPI00260E7BB1|nr:tetratricopeptide repeat protein [Acaryochloris sp. IP29b_bin.148]
MQKKSNRWFIWVFVVVAVVALFGFSFGSIFDSILSSRPSPSPTVPTAGTTPTPPAVSDTEKKDLQDLENGYLQILEKEPNNSDALLGLAEARSQMLKIGLKKEQDLIDPLEKLVELNPEQTQYKVLLAQTLQKAGKRESAAQTYRSILATQPGDMNALQGFVNLLVEQQRPAAAVELLETTLKNAPQANQVKPNSINDSAVKLLLGQVYTGQKQFDQALAVYDKLIANDPKDFRPVFAKAILLKEQGKAKEANILFNSAEKLAPGQYKDQIKAAAKETPAETPPSPTSPSSPSPQPSPSSPTPE